MTEEVELGIIEGYYGKPWSFEEREETMAFLARHGFRFYLYTPKADPHLRRLWREPHPPELAASIAALARRCRDAGVRFGIGISPAKAHLTFDQATRDALAAKLAFFDDVGAEDVAILFDDFRGDLPDLADRQAEIVHWAVGRTRATRVFVCPSYYTDDPVLDRVFGPRPERYVERFGALVDPAIDIFWTGAEVISREISPGHIGRVAEQLGRKPFIWDNYPVNDGARMSLYLHVRAFTGRPAALAGEVAGHGINPALQPTLTRVPALTLVDSYRMGADYQYGEALQRRAAEVLGAQLGRMIWEDLLQLQDVGLDRLGEKAAELRSRYAAVDHPGAREVVAWLDGEYRITDEIIRAQSGEE